MIFKTYTNYVILISKVFQFIHCIESFLTQLRLIRYFFRAAFVLGKIVSTFSLMCSILALRAVDALIDDLELSFSLLACFEIMLFKPAYNLEQKQIFVICPNNIFCFWIWER